MAKNMMAFPELRHPFESSPVHPDGARTVLYQGRTIQIDQPGPEGGLKVSPKDLQRITGFELKPEGACFESACIPLRGDVLTEADGQQWVDLEGFAQLLGQPYVADADTGVYAFGEIPLKRDNTMVNAKAPEFEVTDRKGNVLRLADLKGKKALIVTWSSW